MRWVLLFFIGLGWLTSNPGFAADDDVPDPKLLRAKIEKLIEDRKASKQKATMGLLNEAFTLSISFGAPVYNKGDHEACYEFYVTTGRALNKAFETEDSATPAAWDLLKTLQSALERIRKSKNADRNAWTMRYVFDKSHVSCELMDAQVMAMIQTGAQYYKLSQFEEAQDAYQSATNLLAEMEGRSWDEKDMGGRFAYVGLANSMFAQKNFAEAADKAMATLKAFPEWAEVKFDLRSLHREPDEYESTMEELLKQVQAHPNEAGLRFLLGYEYYFTGKKTAAREQLDLVEKQAPGHPGAKQLLKFLPKPPDTRKPGGPETPKPAQDF